MRATLINGFSWFCISNMITLLPSEVINVYTLLCSRLIYCVVINAYNYCSYYFIRFCRENGIVIKQAIDVCEINERWRVANESVCNGICVIGFKFTMFGCVFLLSQASARGCFYNTDFQQTIFPISLFIAPPLGYCAKRLQHSNY